MLDQMSVLMRPKISRVYGFELLLIIDDFLEEAAKAIIGVN